MKLICVTGGVLSGLGKGICGASIGALLKSAGYNVFMQKFDGYLNVDPGTMNPTQHGEVFVMKDGSESDLDIGHYERFLDTDLNGSSTRTTGKLFEEIISDEREGKFLGQTVQIIPHVTNKVKDKIKEGAEQSGADISIVEIGGTVGDIESEYLIESLRQMRQELGYHSVVFVHLTYVPYLEWSKELKTKPTQMSVKDLMTRGIHPDFVVLRSDKPVGEEILEKVSRMCGVHSDHLIPAPTVSSIYQIPLDYHHRSVGHHILDHFELPYSEFKLDKWESLNKNIKNSTNELQIAMVGKYVGLEDAYYSLNEGLKVAGWTHGKKVVLTFVEAEDITHENVSQKLSGFDGICVPGGFGDRGIEGMIHTCTYARENNIPYLGICLGSQVMAIEFARNVLGLTEASSEEFAPKGTQNVVHMMEHQRSIETKGGTMRLGSYACVMGIESKIGKIYAEWGRDDEVSVEGDVVTTTERHRHRFEFNNQYRDQFEQAGFHISGTSPDGQLVEMVEMTDHPCMIATQAHPELKSRPTYPHPLFMGFVGSM